MATPWGYGPKQFEITAGVQTLVRLDVPHRGTIVSINLEQIGGSGDGELQIYDSEAAARAVADAGEGDPSSISGSSEDVAGGEPPVHSITGPLAISTGRFFDNTLSISYINRDGTPTNGVKRLWAVLLVTGTGQLAFTLSMTIKPAELTS